jgi:predicted DNA-binding helix-hairpin-helix protein
MDTRHKLNILADAAKYDASCASSGLSRREAPLRHQVWRRVEVGGAATMRDQQADVFA